MMVQQVTPLKIIEEGQRLWNSDRQPSGCTHCHRGFLALDSQINASCPLCRTGHLEPQALRLNPAEPERVLPFRIKPEHLRSLFTQFTSGVWIKPEDFTTENLLQRTQKIFWPLWLVDSDVEGQWQMEAGFDYQVESSKEYFQDGQWRSRKLVEDRIRWEPRLGGINYHVDNVPVPALEEHQNRQQMTGAYRLENAGSFHLDKSNDALIEAPDLPPADAWPLAKPQVNKRLSQVCAEAADAQHSRNFNINAKYQKLNWTQFLLPMYTSYYKDDEGNPQILVINGETGEIQGPRLASQKRGWRIAAIIGGIAAVLLLFALLGFLITPIFPPASIFAVFSGILGFTAGVGALIPAIWPSQWNRKNQSSVIIKRD
jgi:hypothetical protein